MIEERKKFEAELHNKLRDRALEDQREKYEFLTSNDKFYSINRKSKEFVNNLLLADSQGKKVLDYCCGNGRTSVFLAKNGVNAYGIDISDVSIENAKMAAKAEGVESFTHFDVMDAEATSFPADSFDKIICSGVLHHLNIERAFKELARILKPKGVVICNEPLIYNPIFQLYRRKTPHLRSAWETDHILSRKEINLAKKYFNETKKLRFFHLAALFAVPFKNTFLFNPFLGALELIDLCLLKLPFVKWWAWQVVFVLAKPKK